VPRELSTVPPRFLTIPQVVEALGVSRSTVQRWLNSGVLPHTRLGGRALIPLKALTDMEERAFSEAAQKRADIRGEPTHEEDGEPELVNGYLPGVWAQWQAHSAETGHTNFDSDDEYAISCRECPYDEYATPTVVFYGDP
jgi:excisionase family DNA binding protein